MNRRQFIEGLTTVAVAPGAATAAERCNQGSPWQPPVCIAEVDLSDISYQPQRQSQWCWAASAQIIFAYHGFDVPQEQIVETVYGGLVNLPAFRSATITQLLSRDWQDRNGKMFRCTIRGLYDAFSGTAQLNNVGIINALRANNPLFYCNRSHAMVQTAIVYAMTPMGPNVINIGLIDPWPGNGARGPQYGEMTPVQLGGSLTYLAVPTIISL
jgi:hypothetical protein